MSLYHETAGILSTSASEGGSLKSKIFTKKDLKSPAAQVYALALESCKWSPVLKEVIDNSQVLRHERKLTPILSLLLVHDFLVAKGGIALPQSHGLRAAVERHKARLTSELTRARLRRKCATLDDLRALVEVESRDGPVHPRWIRINTLKTTVPDQLETTFAAFQSATSIQPILEGAKNTLWVDGHVPNLLAVSPGVDFTKTDAYKSGAIILQDKASCFPAYLLDPRPEDGDFIDTCAAPGNKTTHLGTILDSRTLGGQTIHACEKDKNRAKTLERMVKVAGTDRFTKVHQGQDFMKVDPNSDDYKNVGALLLDPSCSGSGIVGRDDMPSLHLPDIPGKPGTKPQEKNSRKRKREGPSGRTPTIMVDDDGETTVLSSEKDLKARIEALAAFQLSLLLHAFSFPAAKKITYSTCSVHAGENEHVVLKALGSEIAKTRGWRILSREDQVRGMREWPVRGDPQACDGNEEVADACIRTYRNDGRGVMGFFVAAFVRDEMNVDDGESPFLRDEDGFIVRDENGMPTLKATGKKAVNLPEDNEAGDGPRIVEFVPADDDRDGSSFLRDDYGRIVRGPDGMPTPKPGVKSRVANTRKRSVSNTTNIGAVDHQTAKNIEVEGDGSDSEWDGFGD